MCAGQVAASDASASSSSSSPTEAEGTEQQSQPVLDPLLPELADQKDGETINEGAYTDCEVWKTCFSRCLVDDDLSEKNT